MSPKPKKPHVPSESEALVADRLWNAMSSIDTAPDDVPKHVVASLQYLTKVGKVVDTIRREQPVLLEPYAADLIAVVQGALPLSDDDAALLVVNLLGSTTLARILADTANGNLDPVAATTRRRPKTAKKTAAKKAAAVPKTEPAAAAAAVPEPEAAPVPDLAVPSEPDTGETVPGDFDDSPAVISVATAPSAVAAAPEPSPEPVAVGGAKAVVGEDDF